MQDIIINTIERYGYLAVFLLITLENVFPPIPSEIVLSFAGFATKHTSMNPIGAIIAATLGSVLGALILYWVGRLLTPERMARLLNGWVGRVLRFKPDDLAKTEAWFNRRGSIAVFICRFVPIVRSLISIPAGMSRMNVGKFTALSAAGTLIWNIVLIYLGRAAGHAWPHVAGIIDRYAYVSLIVLAIAFVALIVVWRRKHKRA